MVSFPDIEPPIIVASPTEHPALTILTFDALKDFAEKENRAWEALNGNSTPHLGVCNAIQAQKSWVARLYNYVQIAASNDVDAAERLEALTQVRALVDQVQAGEAVSAATFVGKKLLHLLTTDPLPAKLRLAYLTRRERERGPNELDLPMARAVVREILDDTDLAISIALGEGILEEHQKKWKTLIQDTEARTHFLQDQLVATVAQAQEEVARLSSMTDSYESETQKTVKAGRTVIDESLQGMSKQIDTARENASADLKTTRDTFASELALFRATLKSQLGLQAPVTYWTAKARKHRIVMRCALIGFGVGMALFVGFFFKVVPSIVSNLPRTNDGGISLGELVVVTIPALGFFWMMRYVGRLIVSNESGAADAELRATMTQTFLALAAADGHSGIGDAERLVILQALFRAHASDGENDAPPPNLLEIVKNISGRTER